MSKLPLPIDKVVQLIVDTPDPSYCSKVLKLLDKALLQRNLTIETLDNATQVLKSFYAASKIVSLTGGIVSTICIGIEFTIFVLGWIFAPITMGITGIVGTVCSYTVGYIGIGATGATGLFSFIKCHYCNEQMNKVREAMDEDMRCYNELQTVLDHVLPFEPPTYKTEQTFINKILFFVLPEKAAKWLQIKVEWLGLSDITIEVPDEKMQKIERQDKAAQLSMEIQDHLHVRAQKQSQDSQKESDNSDSSFLKCTIKMVVSKMRAALNVASAGLKGVLKLSILILQKIEQNISITKAARVLGCIGKFVPVINLLLQGMVFLVELAVCRKTPTAAEVIQEILLPKLMEDVSTMMELEEKLLKATSKTLCL